jgi:hypothetical protein
VCTEVQDDPHIYSLPIISKSDPIRPYEPIRYNPYIPRIGIKSIHHIGEVGEGSEVIEPARSVVYKSAWVREYRGSHPRFISEEHLLTRRMNLHIIQRVKLPPKKVVQQHRRVERGAWIDEY